MPVALQNTACQASLWALVMTYNHKRLHTKVPVWPVQTRFTTITEHTQLHGAQDTSGFTVSVQVFMTLLDFKLRLGLPRDIATPKEHCEAQST